MKQQIANRLGAAHIRDTMMQFIAGSMTREQAMASLEIGKSRLYELRTSFLAARASGRVDVWEPSRSGGNHMPAWPKEVHGFLKERSKPGRKFKALFVCLCRERGGSEIWLDGRSCTSAALGFGPWHQNCNTKT